MNQPQNTGVPPGSNGRTSRLGNCLKLPLAFAGHIGYLLTLTCVLVVSLLVLLPLTPFPGLRRRFSSFMLRRSLRFFSLYYLPAVQACRIVEMVDRDRLTRFPAAIFIANHRSSIDAILLLSLLPPTSLIIKARHVRKIAYACLVRFFDFVSIEAGNRSVLRQSMDKCRILMAHGMSLLIFPEGMRASSAKLMPFADYAFRMAIEQGVPIVPIVIHSDRPFLNRQKGSYFPPEPVLFRIRVLEPIFAGTERDPGRLSDLAAHRMAAVLTELDRTYLK